MLLRTSARKPLLAVLALVGALLASTAHAALPLDAGPAEEGLVRADGARASGTLWDSASWDSASWDSASWDSASWDSARWDSASWDSARWDSARWDSSRWDSSRWDGAGEQGTLWDSARWDSSRWDSARWDSARWDGSAFETDPLLGYQWGLAALRVPEAWTLTTGDHRRTLCVLDTGVDAAHPDLAPNLAGGWNFLDGNADLTDHAGHGTHVAGVAAASVGNGLGTAGVGDARLLVGKVLNAHGVGGLGTLAKGIRWCADQGAHVIGMSLGSDQDSPAVRRAVEHALAKGAILVASAGNRDGCDACPVYPAAYPGVVGVSALALAGGPAPFADPAPHVDVAAPGELLAGPLPGGAYALGTGTSQATALVAGALALAWDANPSLSAAQVVALLQETARDLGPAGWDPETGWGVPDVGALVAHARTS